MLVPLQEVVAEAMGKKGVNTKTVISMYDHLLSSLGSEFDIMLRIPLSEITKIGGSTISKAIKKVRLRNIHIDPGYDGVFGVVKIWKSDENKPLVDGNREQISLF